MKDYIMEQINTITCNQTNDKCQCEELKKKIKHIEKELYDLKVIVSKLTGNYTLCFDSNYECKF